MDHGVKNTIDLPQIQEFQTTTFARVQKSYKLEIDNIVTYIVISRKMYPLSPSPNI